MVHSVRTICRRNPFPTANWFVTRHPPHWSAEALICALLYGGRFWRSRRIGENLSMILSMYVYCDHDKCDDIVIPFLQRHQGEKMNLNALKDWRRAIVDLGLVH